ncbi:ABC transporter permease [Aequorivita capsosiphonis]|uniref:ABC transporter permease n=1 Tax=Aequorivita capsosiphonis TaxID=487317 RepID=UPI00040CC5E0|nr:ABC transporter permease [Aequorivita capsosiphonis]
MIKNYFKIAIRNLWRHRGYSVLNIGGLAIGMTAGFLVLLYVGFEMSYDSFHSKADRLYRLSTDIKTPSDKYETPVVDWNILSELESEFPEIEMSTLVMGTDIDVKVGNENYTENRSLAAGAALFQMFDFKLLEGHSKTALSAPLSIVLDKTTAAKYFGDGNAMGKTLKIMDGKYSVTVTGVMDDMPNNSMVKGNIILSISTYTEVIDPTLKDSWANFENLGFVLLNPETDANVLEAKFKPYVEKIHGEQMKSSNMQLAYFLEPIQDIYLYSDRGSTPQITNIYIFSIVGLFILLIAAINFINLTTARSVERAKEVGIRKVIGAQKGQLAFQFLGESLIICLFAFLIAVGLSMLALPYFNELAGKVVATSIFAKPLYILSLLAISVFIAIVAGAYPALVLSSFKAVKVLKGKFSRSSKGILLRKGLVVLQFSISVILIIGTFVIYSQTYFMQHQDLGFSKEQLLILPTNNQNGQEEMQKALASNPDILSMSTSSSVPGGGGEWQTALSVLENNMGQDQSLTLNRFNIDENYIPQFDIKLLAGRNFSKQFASDSTEAMILNEKAIKLLGFADPADAIGKSFEQWDKKGTVIGVIKDFHIQSLQEEIMPLSMVMGSGDNKLLNLKVSTQNLGKTLGFIKKYWQEYFPNKSFDYFFMDAFFNQQYKSEERFASLFLNFALLAIFISCLGLLGLASYSTLQRRREIGIRKILGSSAFGIVHLLSADFLKLVAIAILIASPIAWYGMHSWLQDFAYRIDIPWWIFLVAGILAIGIALVTISFQAIKAAIANPVKSLRTE